MKPSRGPSDDDIFMSYMNRGGSNAAGHHKWNEHQYFVKAMEDLHRSQQNKMAKVSQPSIASTPVWGHYDKTLYLQLAVVKRPNYELQSSSQLHLKYLFHYVVKYSKQIWVLFVRKPLQKHCKDTRGKVWKNALYWKVFFSMFFICHWL